MKVRQKGDLHHTVLTYILSSWKCDITGKQDRWAFTQVRTPTAEYQQHSLICFIDTLPQRNPPDYAAVWEGAQLVWVDTGKQSGKRNGGLPIFVSFWISRWCYPDYMKLKSVAVLHLWLWLCGVNTPLFTLFSQVMYYYSTYGIFWWLYPCLPFCSNFTSYLKFKSDWALVFGNVEHVLLPTQQIRPQAHTTD